MNTEQYLPYNKDVAFIRRLVEARFPERQVVSIEPHAFQSRANGSYSEYKTLFFGQIYGSLDLKAVQLETPFGSLSSSKDLQNSSPVMFITMPPTPDDVVMFIGYKIVLNDPFAFAPLGEPTSISNVSFSLRRLMLKNGKLKIFGYSTASGIVLDSVNYRLVIVAPDGDRVSLDQSDLDGGTEIPFSSHGVFTVFIEDKPGAVWVSSSNVLTFDIPFDNDPLEHFTATPTGHIATSSDKYVLSLYPLNGSSTISVKISEAGTIYNTLDVAGESAIEVTNMPYHATQSATNPKAQSFDSTTGDLGILQSST